MLKHSCSNSSAHNAWKIVSKVKPIHGFPALVAAGLSLLRMFMFSARVIDAPQKIDTPVDVVDTKSVPQEQDSGTNQIERVSIPSAAYASIQVKDGNIHIAEARGDDITTYKRALLNKDAATEVLGWLKQTSQERHLEFIAASLREEDQLRDITSRLWLEEDIVPYTLRRGDAAHQQTIEEQVRGIASNFDENNIVYPCLTAANEIQVAELVTREDYQRITSPEDFALLQKLAQAIKGKKLVFINATPQGGGVALMRHALIRLLRLFEVDAHWYVLKPKKEVFDITKTKFHNVLQAVASPEITLTPEDEAVYNAWIRENAAALEDVFQQADVVVIDDPQPAGLIPYIKYVNPEAKIIYRSHIQIVRDLVNQPGTPQHTTWSFLWDKIQHTDCFVSHPMSMFIPDNVPPEKIFYMPATTDPLDGLNKPLTVAQMSTYMKLFNALLLQAGQTPLDDKRPYIIQVARFDPSKGILDVLDAYRKLRVLLEAQHQVIPQLVISGNGSIDDPDRTPVYNLIWNMLQSEPYAGFAGDIKVVHLPHRDQILNTLLRQSKVVLQLSIKEGFEVKVTEALMKGKPVIAYNTGGIPLQIQDGISSYLIEVGNTTQVAQHLYTLLTDGEKYQRMSQAAAERACKDYLTVPNAICWLYLAQELVNGRKLEGHYQWVKALAEQNFGN